MGKLLPPRRQSWAMGIVAAAGSFGQFLMVPVAAGLIDGLGWFGTLLIFAAAAFLIAPLGTALTRGLGQGSASGGGQSARQAFHEAFGERSFVPLTPVSVYVFAAAISFLWLSTVPLTNAIVVQVFGVRYLGMLSGFVFFSHQIGSFLGVWLGGRLFDSTGSYDIVWSICIALGVVAALLNLPIKESSLESRRIEAPA